MDRLRYPRLRGGLVGAWCPSVDRSRSTLLVDQSVYGNHGTLTSMDPVTDWVPSEGKIALDFDGSNDFVNYGTVPAFRNFSTVSMSAWLYATANAGSFVWGRYDSRSGVRSFALLYTSAGTSTPRLATTFSANDGSENYSGWAANSDCVPLNRWVHLAITVNLVTRGINLFVNGVEFANTRTDTGTGAGTTIGAGTTLIRSGVITGFSGSDAFSAMQIDDILVYNRVLGVDEIATLALRRGIAYETYRVPVVRGATVGGGGFKPYWAARKSSIIGRGF